MAGRRTPAATITVALPLYRAQRIAWLALEGLCRQQCSEPWELLIAEEVAPEHMPFGRRRLRQYEQRLRAAGCVRIHHIPLQLWVPLPRKWAMLAAAASPASEVFILHAGDCYSEPQRLMRSLELVRRGADWVHRRLGIFFNLISNRKALYIHPEGYHTALGMAVRTPLVRTLPDSDLRSGIDRWLFRHATRAKGDLLRCRFDESEGWRQALDTHGCNNISGRRGDNITLERAPFHHTRIPIRSVLPEQVRAQLVQLIEALRTDQPQHA